MNIFFTRICLVILFITVLASFFYQQYKYLSYDKQLFEMVGGYIESEGDGEKEGSSSAQWKKMLSMMELEKLRNDFNFNFITGFLATVILSIGIGLFLHVCAQQKKIDNKITDLKRVAHGHSDELKRIEGRFKILDIEASKQPIDLLYALIRGLLLSILWEEEFEDHRYLEEVQSWLQRILQIVSQPGVELGHYEFLKICEKIPDAQGLQTLKSEIDKILKFSKNSSCKNRYLAYFLRLFS